MPTAHAGETKYAYRDHDTDYLKIEPPVLNQWYLLFDAEDVRLIWCWLQQYNEEAAAKDLEVKWTIDGTVYFIAYSALNYGPVFIFRDHNRSNGGVGGLGLDTSIRNAAYYCDKRGQRFKVEVRITSALGTNQGLHVQCVHETLEQT